MKYKSFILFTLGFVLSGMVFLIRHEQVAAIAPSVKVRVVDVETNEPIGGMYVRWRHKGGGSYGDRYKENDPSSHPRRYKKAGVNGEVVFEAFQTANEGGKEEKTELSDLNDPDYQGLSMNALNPAGAAFGCGQKDHSMNAVSPIDASKRYVCEEAPFSMKPCGNHPCQLEVTVQCKTAKKQETVGDIAEPKKDDLNLGSDSVTGDNPNDVGVTANIVQFACIEAQGCASPYIPPDEDEAYDRANRQDDEDESEREDNEDEEQNEEEEDNEDTEEDGELESTEEEGDVQGEHDERDKEKEEFRNKLCTPQALSEEVAPYTTRLAGLHETARNLSLGEQDVWVLQCFNEVDPDSTARPSQTSEDEDEGEQTKAKTNFAASGYRVICTTGSNKGDEAAIKAGVLPRISYKDNNTTHFAYLEGEYGLSTQILSISQNTRDNALPVRTPVEQPFRLNSLQEDIEWVTKFSKIAELDYIFLLAYAFAGNETGEQNLTYSQDQARLNTHSGCNLIQDPYGTVFDSYTLEPLPGASVQLLRQKGEQYVPVTQTDAPAVTQNPYSTGKDGRFEFFVPDGRYKLDVSREGYIFPGRSTELNPSYDLFYSDIYTGEPIIQHGEIEHRDVPLDPVDKEEALAFAQNNPVKVLSLFQTVDRESHDHIIQGRASHPRAQVSVYGKELIGGDFRITRQIGQTEADMDGRFKITIPLETLQKGEIIGEIEVMKKKIQ